MAEETTWPKVMRQIKNMQPGDQQTSEIASGMPYGVLDRVQDVMRANKGRTEGGVVGVIIGGRQVTAFCVEDE
jgi:hypothetical protein